MRNKAAYWATRRYRDQHRAEGLCIFCHRPNDGLPSSLCRFHRRQNRLAVRRYRDQHRAEGLCIFCSRPNDGKPSALCRVHRRQQREQIRARTWARIRDKTCQACGRNLSPDEIRRHCRYHLACRKAHTRQDEAARRREPAYRKRRAAYELARQNRLIAAGLCARCGQPRTSRRYCRACLDKKNQAWRARREAA